MVKETLAEPTDFEMVRITAAKRTVNVSTSTIRKYAKLGLRIYKVGKSAYFSRSELVSFIRQMAA